MSIPSVVGVVRFLVNHGGLLNWQHACATTLTNLAIPKQSIWIEMKGIVHIPITLITLYSCALTKIVITHKRSVGRCHYYHMAIKGLGS